MKKSAAKSKLAVTPLDKKIAELASKSDHRILALWAADCAERALPYFERNHPEDDRPRKAISACREWARNSVFRMADVRSVSLAAHAAAREVEGDNPARSAARAAGQAMATAHVPSHAVAAARYAATTVRDANEGTEAHDATAKEREWQYRRLLELRKNA